MYPIYIIRLIFIELFLIIHYVFGIVFGFIPFTIKSRRLDDFPESCFMIAMITRPTARENVS